MDAQIQKDISQAVSDIENTYDRKGKYIQEDGNPKYTAHAVKLEDETGMTGIAGRYKFIDGKDPAFAEYEYRKNYLKYSIAATFLTNKDPVKSAAAQIVSQGTPQALKEVNKELAELTKLNPELKNLNYDNRSIVESYRALIGVTSQYNVDDINAYLHGVRTGIKDPEVQMRVENLKKTRLQVRLDTIRQNH